MTQQSKNPTEVLLRSVRLSYPHLLTPRSFANDPTSVPKYSASLLIPKTDAEALKVIQTAVSTAIERAVAGKFGGKKPAKGSLHLPYRDGDAKDEDGVYLDSNEEARGCYVLRASSKDKPRVVTRNPKVPAVEEDIWPGEEAHVLVNFGAYKMGANAGIACYLNAVQVTGRGERIDGRTNPEDAFAGLENDASNDSDFDDGLLGSFDDAA
ncbi:DUF2815 family protein [Lamprobacter modestohalophilus]|uniref:DUF2815 family protein n=1 Tax=Lamprobacter modestohalophilus TaxID=1064514 RepID=UPI002ADED446|nr:DUF2815 family protein [Lamprobacter modestohalophilus]MEA1050486.1 DUF2815 family protein [Lamprobacter modestohalophilus]